MTLEPEARSRLFVPALAKQGGSGSTTLVNRRSKVIKNDGKSRLPGNITPLQPLPSY